MTGTTQLRDTFATPESRKMMTIGVIDINESTAMKERDPEAAWLNSLGWFYDTATDLILSEIPMAVVKYVGDAAMFACDTEHTTEAVNVVIRIQEAIKEAGTGSDGAKGVIDFTCSAALTTGQVRAFTTPVGTIDFVGAVVDKAFRLCSYANAKAVFVDTATVGAANSMRISSRFGTVAGYQSDHYTGEIVKASLKGFALLVAYHEILWDQQRYSVAGAEVTASTERLRSTTTQPALPGKEVRPERHRGRVTHWNSERNCGVVSDPATGEDFYIAPRLMVYSEDVDKITLDREVVFVATGVAEGNRKRQATAMLIVGEPAEGPLVSRAPGKPYGWIRVEDTAGNRHLVYLPATELGVHRVGDMLSFTVCANDKGACASDVTHARDAAA